MEYIGVDVCLYAGYFMLVAVDYFWNFIWMSYIVDHMSATIIEALMLVFRHSGYPSFLLSDNALNLVSQEMQNFCRNRNITHLTLIPHNPQLNGKAESAVKTVKSEKDTEQSSCILQCTVNESQHAHWTGFTYPSWTHVQSQSEDRFAISLSAGA